MKCPHCLKVYHSAPVHVKLNENPKYATDQDGYWSVLYEECPACERLIITLWVQKEGKKDKRLVWPKGIARSPVPKDVPPAIAGDYLEACLVFADSPKASAALSRRCLQHLLKECAKTTKRDLADQITEAFPSLPTYLREQIDGVRAIGNFAAHPLKSTNTGEIIDVEPGEAEWLLDTLEMLFDFYCVQPAEAKRKRDAINSKLKEVGKPPIK
jgi:hypothetical protein